MTDHRLTRRGFLASAAGAALLASLPGCGVEAGLGETHSVALLRMARLLYPHEALPDDVYAQVLRPLESRALDEPIFGATLRAGLDELDQVAGQEWRTASAMEQIVTLERIEETPFFATVRDALRTRLYERPELWDLVGYEGPSAPYGGYLNRGFDDIDWLPED
jgi:hypothetical protein